MVGFSEKSPKKVAQVVTVVFHQHHEPSEGLRDVVDAAFALLALVVAFAERQ